ncbi:MAG: hypothetical protein GQ574_20680 [Crocinitomix sp.]|nr:hypothetical protein [Crocinitomix sp.]
MKKNKTPKQKRILKHAKAPEERALLFEVLNKFNKIELFPDEFLTREKASESYLSNWLYQHEEYDSLPDDIHCVENSELNDRLIVFKFKSNEPHFLANKGWVYGYVGYNFSNDKPYGKPDLLMSDFDNVMLTLDECLKILEETLSG